MFRTINDFLEAWKYESEATLKVFGNLTDESLNQKVTEDGRSLGFIAWHITNAIPNMLSKAGLPISYDENTPVPTSAETIKNIYEKSFKVVNKLIPENWNDKMLNDDINVFGEVWKRAKVLVSLITHQAHHRGQMTVLMRQAGLKVPGVYGPAKEEWAEYGMPTQE